MKGDHCACIARNHGHKPGACDEPEPPTGAIACTLCRYHVSTAPGADGALAAGCTCPVVDNNHGQGYMGQAGVFVMMLHCPLHGVRE